MNRAYVLTIFMVLAFTLSPLSSSAIHTQEDLALVCEKIKTTQHELTTLRNEVNRLLDKIQRQEGEFSLHKRQHATIKGDWLSQSFSSGDSPLAGFIVGVCTLPILSFLLSKQRAKKRKEIVKKIKPLEIDLKNMQEKYAHTETALHELIVQKQELEYTLRLATFTKKHHEQSLFPITKGH